ncbi:unnamed protein product [Cuscuta epithymum]|uniref:Uncharacterized protein n=1 Tax=Cuscuta epithymum TaxID=186058 RepID=A0AAV0CH86_9ASTE|nr:unnamed protein product [Cuscuta epithymum]CAH9134040.1 unnamed protein product [Cuscuta epithymum]
MQKIQPRIYSKKIRSWKNLVQLVESEEEGRQKFLDPTTLRNETQWPSTATSNEAPLGSALAIFLHLPSSSSDGASKSSSSKADCPGRNSLAQRAIGRQASNLAAARTGDHQASLAAVGPMASRLSASS